MWRLNGLRRTLEKHDVLFQYWLPKMVSPQTSCCNNLKFLQWKCCSLYCKSFFATNMSLFHSLCNHTEDSSWTRSKALSAEHETPQQTATQDEGRSWYKIMLPDWICTKKSQKGQLWSGIHQVWSDTTSPPKAAHQSCHADVDFQQIRESKSMLPTHPLAWRWSPGLSLVLFGLLGILGNSSSLHIRLKTGQRMQIR